MTRKEVAKAIGVLPNSYANAELTGHKVMSLERVNRLVRMFALSDATTPTAAELIAAWHMLPASPFNARNSDRWRAKNEQRDKARRHDRMQRSLVEVLTLLVSIEPPDALCSCDRQPGAPPCELCAALEVLGLPPWESGPQVISGLSALHDRLSNHGQERDQDLGPG